jgi:hypothetical protein
MNLQKPFFLKKIESCKEPPLYFHVQTNLPPNSYKFAYIQNPKLKLCLKKEI